MIKLSKYFGNSSIIFALLLCVDALVSLFHLSRDESESVITFLGVSINNEFTEEYINTTFSLSIRTLYVYIIYLTVIIIIGNLVAYLKAKRLS